MGADAAAPDDGAAVEAQIGRPSRAPFEVVTRCHFGLPVVIRMPPLLADGTPFPTRYWLTCPLAVLRIDRVEGAGGVREMSERSAADPEFGARLAAAHEAYAADRDADLPDARLRPEGGVAGIKGAGVKCLHAHYAHHAAGHDNPVGEWVAPHVEPLDDQTPCVLPSGERNPNWREPAAAGARQDEFLPPLAGGVPEPEARGRGVQRPAGWGDHSSPAPAGEVAGGGSRRSEGAARARRRAAVDIGTNTARLLIVDVAPDGGFEVVDRAVVVTRLGWGLDASGVIAEQSIARAEDALAGFAQRIAASSAGVVRAIATSATREAANQGEFLARAEEALGVRPRVISGDEEAALSFHGATLRHHSARAPYLVIDPGGGSTEFVLGTDAPEYAISVRMGSVRLTDRALPDHPATRDQVEGAAAAARGAFGAVALPFQPATVVGVGGTFTALGAIALGLEAYDRERVNGTVVPAERFDELVDYLAGLTIAETAAIPSLDPERAPVLLGGAIVVREALRYAGAAEALVSENDLLTALALQAG